MKIRTLGLWLMMAFAGVWLAGCMSESSGLSIVNSTATISPAASTVTAGNGALTLTLPAGAVTTTGTLYAQVPVTTARGGGVGVDAAITLSAVDDLGNAITTLAAPATLTVKYNATLTGSTGGALKLYNLTNNSWVLVPGSVNDPINHTVSAPITVFGAYAITAITE